YERVNLAELGRSQPGDSRTTVRRTLPPPAPRNGVRLGAPAPASEDPSTESPVGSVGAGNRRPNRTTTSPLEDLVTAASPNAPESESTRAAWSARDVPPYGR